MLLEDEASPVLRVTGGPGGEEGALTRVVDPSASGVREFGDLLLAREAKLSREVCTVRPNKGQRLASTPRSSPAGEAGTIDFPQLTRPQLGT